MEFRVEGNLRWEGVVPDACARGKVGSGWWVGVNGYYEVEKWADILRTAHLYHTWTGIIGLEACRKPGCPSGVSHFRRREMAQQSLDDAGSRPSPFFRNCTPFEITSTPVESQKMPKLRQQACETNMHHLVLK